MSKLVVRIVEEDYDSQVCTFEHSIQDDSVILQNDPKLIVDEIEELEAALSYLKGVRADATISNIIINGKKVAVRGSSLPYEKLCSLAGIIGQATVAYATQKAQGTVTKEQSGPIEDGIIYNINYA